MKSIFIPILAIVLLGSCHRCHKARQYRQQAATGKYQPAVKEGSYFIYRNAIHTTQLDTFKVVHSYDSMLFSFAEAQCDGNYFQQQGFRMDVAGSNDSVNVAIRTTASTDEYSISGRFHEYGIISYYSVSGGKIEVSNYWGDSVTSLQTYTVAGRTYNDVVCISVFQYRTSQSPIKYYFAAGIGLIQFSTYDQEYSQVKDTYELVDYSIH